MSFPVVLRPSRSAWASAALSSGYFVRRVLGDGRGGYEWVNPADPIPRGITALGLDEDGRVEQLSVVYDAALLDDDELVAATGRVPDPREE